MAAAIVFFVLIQALSWMADGRQQIGAIASARAVVALLKDRYVERKKVAVNLDLYRNQLREADRLFGRLLYELPNRIDDTFLPVRIAARARGLCIELLGPKEGEGVSGAIAEREAALVLSGPFQAVAAFIADLTRLPASVRLDPFVIERSPSPGRVVLRARLRAFRYRDDQEIAAQLGLVRVAGSASAPDFKEELRARSKGLRGRIDPLPDVPLLPGLEYPPNLADPFYPAQAPAGPPPACKARKTEHYRAPHAV